MRKAARPSFSERANQQAATVLLAATLTFLRGNKVGLDLDLNPLRKTPKVPAGRIREFRRLVRAYEDMGTVMSTWFSHPKYLDREGRPLQLTLRGAVSVRSLVRSSRVSLSVAFAAELMQRSPSIRIDGRGKFIALRRVFVLPDFEVPRAALVIERYLDTLRKNSSAQKNGTTLLLERNCHVSEIDLKRISPILRDIKERGKAFMDSIDGDIEAHRLRRPRRKRVGELGVLTFAWTRTSRTRSK